MARILQNKNAIYILLALGALFGVLFLRPGHTPAIIAGGHIIPVTILDSEPLRQQGLSGTKSLPNGTGALFIFDTPGVYGFWMKDMRYPIDIVWIDERFKVIGVEPSVTPESYPTVFYPPDAVQYVLEVNAGESKGDNLVVGAMLHLQK